MSISTTRLMNWSQSSKFQGPGNTRHQIPHSTCSADAQVTKETQAFLQGRSASATIAQVSQVLVQAPTNLVKCALSSAMLALLILSYPRRGASFHPLSSTTNRQVLVSTSRSRHSTPRNHKPKPTGTTLLSARTSVTTDSTSSR